MSELKPNETIKALECCVSGYCFRDGCPLCEPVGDDDIQKCTSELAKNALSLIKELTEENERLIKRNFELAEKGGKVVIAYKKLSEENEKLLNHYFIDTTLGSGTSRQKCIEETVQKFSERLTEAAKHYPQRCGDCFKQNIDKIANELIEEEICENS